MSLPSSSLAMGMVVKRIAIPLFKLEFICQSDVADAVGLKLGGIRFTQVGW